MSSIHSRAARSQSRTMQTLDTFDLVLEKHGRRRDITPEQREATAAFAESQGYPGVARKIREENARWYGFGRPALEAVPDDPRRPLVSTHDRPILVGLPGGESVTGQELDPAAMAWGRIAASAEHSLVSLSLNPLDAEDFRALARAARLAASPHPRRPEELPNRGA
jgi:hypothetical protein